MTIGVVLGGLSPEHDISVLTGLQAARALHDDGSDVVCLYWTKTGAWKMVPPTTEAASFLEPEIPGATDLEFGSEGFVEKKRLRSNPVEFEAILNCCHGGPGEDGSLAAMLRLAGLKVTGPSPLCQALTLDKIATGLLASTVGVPAIETGLVVDSEVGLPEAPWIAKPRFGGSSVGIEANISDIETVKALGKSGVGKGGMLVQPYLDGWIDLNIAVRTYPDLQVSAIERPLKGDSEIYGYKEKYLTGGSGMDASPRELPADIPDSIAKKMTEYAMALVPILDISGAPRIDFLWDGEDEVKICEINPIPGAWGNHLWEAIDVPKVQLYKDLLAEAKAAAPLPQWTGVSDGQALRMSGSIASKLN